MAEPMTEERLAEIEGQCQAAIRKITGGWIYLSSATKQELCSEVRRLRALCERHGIDPDVRTDMPETPHCLHIYGQKQWHDTAEIVGTPEAIAQLAEQLRLASIDGYADGEYMAADGEGYGVVCHTASERKVDSMRPPYTETDW